jgi:hypothetical protein
MGETPFPSKNLIRSASTINFFLFCQPVATLLASHRLSMNNDSFDVDKAVARPDRSFCLTSFTILVIGPARVMEFTFRRTREIASGCSVLMTPANESTYLQEFYCV